MSVYTIPLTYAPQFQKGIDGPVPQWSQIESC